MSERPRRCDFCGLFETLTIGPTREPFTQSAVICAPCVWRCADALVDAHRARTEATRVVVEVPEPIARPT